MRSLVAFALVAVLSHAVIEVPIEVKYLPTDRVTGSVPSSVMTDGERPDASVVIDAFEPSGMATIEGDDASRSVIPRAWIPAGAREGDVLRVSRREDAGRLTLTIEVDDAATEQRRAAMRERRQRLPKGPKGDLDL